MAIGDEVNLRPFSQPAGFGIPNTIRTNDNRIRDALLRHATHGPSHNQSGPVAQRPATPPVGTVWIATDTGSEGIAVYTAAGWVTLGGSSPGGPVDWTDVLNKPSTFPPSAHTHPWGDITSTPTTLAGYGIADGQPLDSDLTAIAALSTNGFARRTGAGTWEIVASDRLPVFASAITGSPSASTYLRGDGSWAAVSGSGDVVGPASATNNAIVRFDGTTGKLVKNSAVTIADNGVTFVDGSATTDVLRVRGLARQIVAEYDGSTKLSIGVLVTGGVLYESAGSSPSHRFNATVFSESDVVATANLYVGDAVAATTQWWLSHAASGVATYSITAGATREHRFGNPVNVNTADGLRVQGNKVIGVRGSAVAKPTGGTVQDSEARAAIDAIIDRLRVTGGHGLIAD